MATPSFVRSVVRTCLGIGSDDSVNIFTWQHTLDLAEAFALECQKAGASVHLEVETDALYYQAVLDLPIEYLREANPFSLALLDVATANIFLAGPKDPERLKQITPERMSAMVEADRPYGNKLLEKRVRSAHVLLGYVTPQRAQTYGFNYDAWRRNILAAIDVDYSSMRELGKKVGKRLQAASEVRITAANGTDLTLALEGRDPHVNDGIIDEEDIQNGVFITALPAGSVAVAPKERSARGVFFSDVPEPDAGLLIRNVALRFEEGKLVSLEGQNAEALRARWASARGDRDQASWLMVGLNPAAERGYVYNQIILGSVTLGIGDNRELGGKMESDFGAHCTVERPSIDLDGTRFVDRGKLVFR
jgi:leucyl aminopeptidase (aminopeptidase T)